RWTGGTIRHIDGPLNRDRSQTSKLFLSSPGAFTTMWSPYKDVANLNIPYSVRGPAYPIIGSNTSDYSEVEFNDYLDGNYVLALGMNEQIDRAGNYQVTLTPDTSGNFNNATLQNGAAFPQEYNGNDRLEGRYGQGIYFPAGSYLSVAKNAGWASLQNGITVDMFVRKINSSTSDIRLFDLSNGLRLTLNNGSTLSAEMQDSSGSRQTLSGGNVGSAWTHVAFRFDPASNEMALFVNGQQTASRIVSGFGDLNVGGQLRIGPVNSNALLMLDQVHVSNVARADYEIGHYAYADTHQEPSAALANTIPEHLDTLRDQAFNVERFSFAAAELGELLFNDVLLSKERTTSCATCHDPSKTFTDGLPIAQGNEPTDEGERNTPMLQNRLFSSFQGWGGLSATLDTQALDPIQAAHEMNLPISEALQRLRTEGDYAARFQQVFGEAPNAQNLPQALASFQAIQFSPKTRVDEYLEGNRSVLNASERRGANLFFGDARCSGCHAGANFTDESFRNNGLAQNGDIGRARQTDRARDDRLFKVPSLRAVAHTAPYMHDGSIATLRGVIERYNEGAVGVAGVDTDIRPLELSSQQMDDLVAFLIALSGDGATDSGSGSDPDGGSGDDSGTGSGGGDTANDSASDTVTADNTLGLGSLNANEFIESSNGNYRLFMQGDGNLVLRDWRTMEALWSSGTNGSGAVRLSMQSDGNLVLYTAAGVPVWATSTDGTAANRLTLNNDGSFGLYSDAGRVLSIYGDGADFDGTLANSGDAAGGDDGAGGNGSDGTGTESPASAPALVVDQVTVSQPNRSTWHTVTFDQAFPSAPRVVMGPPSYRGAQPAVVRVRNVTRTGFEFKIDEWDYLDGGHTSETLAYLAVMPGVHDWNGMQVEAGQVDSVTHAWSTVRYSGGFASAPVVLSQQVSDNETQTTTTRLRNSGSTGFEVRVQEAEALGSHAAEQIHYIAITAGQSSVAGNAMQVIAGFTGDRVTHNWLAQSFGRNLNTPLIFADMQTTDGGDTSAIRYNNLTASSVELKVEEEQSKDDEVRHTTENVGWVVFGQ
ncbi:MAG: cytochrome c peroxidase, partial [Oleiphilaceae bacterium]|nr:cytochrome c peroxidase [Oleiphilaceae bacterium]